MPKVKRVAPFLLLAAFVFSAILLGGCRKSGNGKDAKEVTLLNVSYDPTRELYKQIDDAFAKRWKEQSGQAVTVKQSHGGSGKQSRAVLDGLEADVVTLGLAYDIDTLHKDRPLIKDADWQSRLPHNSTPFTTTIVLLVRKNNPKGIHDWDDLVKPGVTVVSPDPRTSGGARWGYLAAWGAKWRPHRDEGAARQFVAELYQHTPSLPAGARDATNLFVTQGQGDALIAWENEAMLACQGDGKDKFEIVVPSVSILAEPPVALVDKYADRHGARKVAEAYLQFLFSDEAQEIGAKNFYRPTSEAVLARYAGQFPKVELFTIRDLFGDDAWQKAQSTHFAPGGVFEQIAAGGK